MADAIKLVRNDNLPEITLTLTDRATGNPIDLSAATTSVVVYFRAVGATNLIATIACSKTSDGSDGKVKFSFPGSTLAISGGIYEGEIEISFNGQKQTIYDLLKFKVREDF